LETNRAIYSGSSQIPKYAGRILRWWLTENLAVLCLVGPEETMQSTLTIIESQPRSSAKIGELSAEK
jgi:hypothetical protein